MTAVEPGEEELAWLTLAGLPGLGGRRCLSLVERFGAARAALAAPAQSWAEVLGPDAAGQARGAPPDRAQARQQWESLTQLGGRLLTLADPSYPALLRQISSPPSLLFVLGDLPLSGPCLAIVGTRRASEHGLAMARLLARDLAARGFCIVSGMARGIDTAAHQGALEARGRTIAVLGCGVDVPYPRENTGLHAQLRQQGAVVSELPMGSPPEAGSFPRRNRLISGLSLGVVVAEAPARSGALITASCGVEQNREVFAVPGEVLGGRSAGCHRLLKEGAKLVEGVEDVVEELGRFLPQVRGEEEALSPHSSKPVLSLSPEEVRVLGQLKAEPCHVDRLAQELALPPSLLLGILLELELAGLVAQLPGKRFARLGG